MTMPHHWWPDSKITAFVLDWNAGLEGWALREKYGLYKSDTVRRRAAKLGLGMTVRRPSMRHSTQRRPS